MGAGRRGDAVRRVCRADREGVGTAQAEDRPEDGALVGSGGSWVSKAVVGFLSDYGGFRGMVFCGFGSGLGRDGGRLFGRRVSD